MINSKCMWAVRFRTIDRTRATTIFWDEKEAHDFIEYCGDADPELFVSTVDFEKVVA